MIIIIYLVESNSNYVQGRAIIFIVNGEKVKKNLNLESNFLYESRTLCDRKFNETKKITFTYMCGLELQIPKIEVKGCITNVLIIDPAMCVEEVSTSYVIFISFIELFHCSILMSIYDNSIVSCTFTCIHNMTYNL